jgi:hypothetical protein
MAGEKLCVWSFIRLPWPKSNNHQGKFRKRQLICFTSQSEVNKRFFSAASLPSSFAVDLFHNFVNSISQSSFGG